jgi:DNA helicase-4
MGYSEIVERVWKNCKESMERNPRDITNFIIKAKTNGLTPEKISERLENEKWSPKQKAFAELALVIYMEYEKELRRTNEIDFSDMINQAIVELETNESLYENSFDHILIDEYQDISRQRYLHI